MIAFFRNLFGTAQERTLKKYKKTVIKINEEEKRLQQLDEQAVVAKTAEFKKRFQAGETLDDLLIESYAVVKNISRRLVGTEVHVSGYDQLWDMVPYDVQIQGAIALHNGYIAEMQTGEGKTLTAVMPLYLNALTGEPVHIVTVNEYLAERDCAWVGTIFRKLGLTTAILRQNQDFEEKKEAYTKDIIYGTASEFGFDYLRDNSVATTKDEQVQTTHTFAIIDEIDSILIDEARTPLIISGPSPVSRQMYQELKPSVDALVKKQKDFCSRLALDAKKVLEKEPSQEAREFNKEEQQSLKDLWLVTKGMPRNKVLRRLQEDPDIRSGIDKCDLYYYSEQNKDQRSEALSDLLIIVDEKASEYELNDKGINAWHECGGNEQDFVMLDLGHEFSLVDSAHISQEEKVQQKLALQELDADRKEKAHNLQQMLRAHLLMERDVDYIVDEGKVVIIDEYTGRPQPGRRFSDGLHQAIEAKEGVTIQRETQTFATITLQNYFRKYKKLAGMTGTAITEAREFKETYKLDVLQVPTHHPCVRKDLDDQMYMTEREKYNAVLEEVKKEHARGRPILIGTESVDVSEKLSRIFKINKLPHVVLNAKNHAHEAEIIAHAGKLNAITIATNMAGRGTDIKLEDASKDAGGLYVIGSTRHQSRRIDRQLRGRSGRQGDPGSSQFYISLEDPLMRLFASPALASWLQRLRPPEGEPISAKILNRSIETAQKRVEGRNSLIRKHTLEYDDVMNKQREEIYTFRNSILHSNDVVDMAKNIFHSFCDEASHLFFINKSSKWDEEGYGIFLMQYIPISFEKEFFEGAYHTTREAIVEKTYDTIIQFFSEKIGHEHKKVALFLQNKDMANAFLEHTLTNIMIRAIDTRWQQHLLTMDHLRSEVHLRSIGQKDPLIEFKQEGFSLFSELSLSLSRDISQSLVKFTVVPPQSAPPELMDRAFSLEHDRSLYEELEQEDAPSLPKKKQKQTIRPAFSPKKIVPLPKET